MKTEKEIAKENIEEFNNLKREFDSDDSTFCRIHKQTCQRWLEFLKEAYGEDSFNVEEEFDTVIWNKIIDLKQAIKLYGDNGI